MAKEVSKELDGLKSFKKTLIKFLEKGIVKIMTLWEKYLNKAVRHTDVYEKIGLLSSSVIITLIS